jgi:hypothetical protein
MKKMGGKSRSTVSMKYIEIPWNKLNEEIKDINIAEKILKKTILDSSKSKREF